MGRASNFQLRRFFLYGCIAVLFALFGFHRASAQVSTGPTAGEGTYVEFLIGDRTPETRKWGHVSLRVVTNGAENIFDFGRYGKMWGMKGVTEGDPMLRVWKHGSYPSYRAYHLKDGGTTRRYRFPSNAARNQRILAYYAKMTSTNRVMGSNKSFTLFHSNYPPFHAVKVNCVTVATNAFMAGFPEYNLHAPDYAQARGLGGIYYGAAQGHIFNDGHWDYIWWPLDLMALFNERYVNRGLVRILPL